MEHNRQRYILGVGLLIVAIGSGSELLSSAAGYGPYQVMLIWIGILIALAGIIPTQSWGTKVLMIVFSVSLTLILLEGLMWLWLKVSPDEEATFYQSNLMADEVLVHRMKPLTQGHDANGWRNPSALEEADIVVIGDSQGWGYNTSIDEAFPLLTGELLNQTVYNMSFPGYGVADYYSLIPEALSHEPDTVLVIIYFGNDFINTVDMVYNRDVYAGFRSDKFDTESTVIDIANLIETAETGRLPSTTPPASSPLLQWLSRTATVKFLIYNGILHLEPSLFDRYRQLPADAPEQQNFFTEGESPLYFMPALREPAMNLDNPLIAEGLRLSELFLSEIQAILNEQDVNFAIVLMPTGELVYAPLVEAQQGSLSPTYSSLVENETLLRDRLITFLDSKSIPYIDLLIPLGAAAQNNEILYPTIDGHPTVAGNQLIAEYIAENWAIIGA